MKYRQAGASALALAAIIVSAPVGSKAITNGVIVITTRSATDALWRASSSSTLYDADDYKGPGVLSPGDAAMSSLLQDYGYATRVVPEKLLWPDLIDAYGVYASPLSPEYYYGGGGGPSRPNPTDSNILYAASLVIVSGSGSSADMPPPNTNGIAIMMGEHSCLGDQSLAGQSSIWMYSNKTSGNATGTGTGAGQYMVVINTTHPIMQGIPLDAQGRVKIWRDPYPEENAHLPSAAPKLNYKYSWTFVDVGPGLTVPAPATVILGVRGDNANHVVFAVNPAGGELSNAETNHGNYVHIFVNEHGSGDSRRAFNALTDLGKVIFVRACKWAMGETLTPYQPLGLIRVSQVTPQQIQLSWDGRADKNYKILGTRNLLGPPDFSNWQTVEEDIPGTNGPITVKFSVAGAVDYAFLRVTQVP